MPLLYHRFQRLVKQFWWNILLVTVFSKPYHSQRVKSILKGKVVLMSS